MLRILNMNGRYKPLPDDTGDTLFKRNADINFIIEAPMYWWLDCEFERFDFIFPKKDFRFCLDEWKISEPYIQSMQLMVEKNKISSPRKLMQILPLSTIITGRVVLSYQKIVEICENYQCGEYSYQDLRNQWPTEREWKDFCETLLDIKGVRDLVEV